MKKSNKSEMMEFFKYTISSRRERKVQPEPVIRPDAKRQVLAESLRPVKELKITSCNVVEELGYHREGRRLLDLSTGQILEGRKS